MLASLTCTLFSCGPDELIPESVPPVVNPGDKDEPGEEPEEPEKIQLAITASLQDMQQTRGIRHFIFISFLSQWRIPKPGDNKKSPHNPPYCGWPLFYCIYNFLYCFHITSFLNSLFDQTPSGTGLHRRHRTDSVKQALIFSFWSFLVKYHYYKRHKHKAHYNHQEISIFTLHEVNDSTYKFFHCIIFVFSCCLLFRFRTIIRDFFFSIHRCLFITSLP